MGVAIFLSVAWYESGDVGVAGAGCGGVCLEKRQAGQSINGWWSALPGIQGCPPPASRRSKLSGVGRHAVLPINEGISFIVGDGELCELYYYFPFRIVGILRQEHKK